MIVQFVAEQEGYENCLETNASPFIFIDAIKNGGIQAVRETLVKRGYEAYWNSVDKANAIYTIDSGELRIL